MNLSSLTPLGSIMVFLRVICAPLVKTVTASTVVLISLGASCPLARELRAKTDKNNNFFIYVLIVNSVFGNASYIFFVPHYCLYKGLAPVGTVYTT